MQWLLRIDAVKDVHFCNLVHFTCFYKACTSYKVYEIHPINDTLSSDAVLERFDTVLLISVSVLLTPVSRRALFPI